MLESVISLSEAENFNNNASYSQKDMTLEAKEDKREEETTPPSQHFTKNSNRGSANTHHIKAKHTVSFEGKKDDDSEHEDNEKEHKTVSKQDSDRTYQNFTLAKKEGRPIYAVRANYRFVLHKILFLDIKMCFFQESRCLKTVCPA